jgi:ribosomal RNA-processing protein 12
MLPLLKDHIEKTELAYFTKYFLPLAKKLRNKSEQFAKNRQTIEHKVFDTLQNQIWSLLPGFCNFPTDLSESFKYLAKTLGETLEKCADLRYYILQSLRILINRNDGMLYLKFF